MSKADRIGRKLEWLKHKEAQLTKQRPRPDDEIRSVREERAKLRRVLEEALDEGDASGDGDASDDGS